MALSQTSNLKPPIHTVTRIISMMNIQMTSRIVFIAILSLAVAACSSQSATKANYYLLNEANSQALGEPKESGLDNSLVHYISIDKIRLSGFLSQPNIAMQMKDHQLYFSNSHLWAERLDSGIFKSLLNDLNQQSSSLHFVSHGSPEISKTSAKLIVEVEHFIATVNSEVILKGKFWLVQEAANDNSISKNIKQSFSYSLTLEKDGYPHSVSKMRELLTLLSDDISTLCEETIIL